MSGRHVAALAAALPPRFRTNAWALAYSTARHGVSLQTLYRRAAGAAATLLVVRDGGGHVFGAFSAEAWRVAPRFYGSGETFVFQLEVRRAGPRGFGFGGFGASQDACVCFGGDKAGPPRARPRPAPPPAPPKALPPTPQPAPPRLPPFPPAPPDLLPLAHARPCQERLFSVQHTGLPRGRRPGGAAPPPGVCRVRGARPAGRGRMQRAPLRVARQLTVHARPRCAAARAPFTSPSSCPPSCRPHRAASPCGSTPTCCAAAAARAARSAAPASQAGTSSRCRPWSCGPSSAAERPLLPRGPPRAAAAAPALRGCACACDCSPSCAPPRASRHPALAPTACPCGCKSHQGFTTSAEPPRGSWGRVCDAPPSRGRGRGGAGRHAGAARRAAATSDGGARAGRARGARQPGEEQVVAVWQARGAGRLTERKGSVGTG
jgi:hypothetical protein